MNQPNDNNLCKTDIASQRSATSLGSQGLHVDPDATLSSSRLGASLFEGNASDSSSAVDKVNPPLHHSDSPQLPVIANTAAARAINSMSSLSSDLGSSNSNSIDGNISSANSVASSSANSAVSSAALPLIPTLFGKKVDLPAAVAATAAGGPRGTKRPRSSAESSIEPQVSEDEGERERRRQDRNLREQQRSHQINHQIDHLRDLLLEAKLRFKPDKYSTLATVALYISELQSKRQKLDEEHSQLLQTLQETANIMTKQYMEPQTSINPLAQDCLSESKVQEVPDGTIVIPAGDSKPPATQSPTTSDSSLLCGIDYKAIFMAQNVSQPLFGTSVTSIEGRFLDCSKGFENVAGFTRQELLPLETSEDGGSNNDRSEVASRSKSCSRPNHIGEDGVARNLSLFNVLDRQDMERIFHTMSDMLRRPVPAPAASNIGDDNVDEDFFRYDTYTTFVTLCRHPGQLVQLSLSLVRTADRRPRLFNCTIIPQGSDHTPVAFNTTG